MEDAEFLRKVGRAINEQRQLIDLTIIDLAAKANIEPAHITGLEEDGSWDIDVSYLVDLVEALDGLISELLLSGERESENIIQTNDSSTFLKEHANRKQLERSFSKTKKLPAARILIAGKKKTLSVITKAVRGYETLKCTTIQEAKRFLVEDGIDLVIVDIHFDDSQAMDLINFLRGDGKHKTTPVIAVRLQPAEQGRILRHTLEIMCRVQGISCYLELDNDPAAADKIRTETKTILQKKSTLA